MIPGTSESAALLQAALAQRGGGLLALLEELARIESHASQPAGVRAVGAVVARELAAAGFGWEARPGPPVPAEDAWLAELMLAEGDYADVAEAVVARKEGAGGGHALLLADLDTSYPAGALERFPFRVEAGLAFGPGVADMKGGLVVLTAALRALANSGLEMPHLTTVVLSPDEQAGSLRSRAVIEAEAAQARWCLCVECARDGGNLLGSRAHIGVARLDVYGLEAHAGSAHGRGVNAIEGLARKIIAIHTLTDPRRGVYVTVGQVRGGRRRSVVPGHAYCTIDIRTPEKETWAEVERELGRISRREDPAGIRAELRVRAHRPGIAWTEKTDRLIEVARRAGSALETSFGVIRSPAAGSSSFAGACGVPTLDGMGPCGADLMTDREHITIGSLGERAALLALTLHLLAQEGGA